MFVLKYPKVAIEILVNCGSPSGLDQDSCIMAIECNSLPLSASYVECLRLGLENYVLQHGNRRDIVCNLCFSSRDQLKVGVGQSFYSGRLRNCGNNLDAVIIISEAQEQVSSSCCMRTNDQTEILYFENFIPSSISQSYVDAFTSIKWEKYGLTLKRASNQDGHALLEWDNLPPQVHISIALHCYCQQVAEPPSRRNYKVPRSLSRKVITSALNELKEKNEGVLLSSHAVKICNYAPDLAKTISRLVLSSNDLQFKGECLSLLGIQVQEMEDNTVERCIREKIVSAVGMNDRKSQRNKEAASILFDDCCSQNVDYLDVDYEDEESNYVDL
ncbi:hypothetical protein Leryth_008012 [Lithospermum erythrorhizon]|nr:hypothetical protein Leryth_008012 [Lithospermum erythrorhizon]